MSWDFYSALGFLARSDRRGTYEIYDPVKNSWRPEWDPSMHKTINTDGHGVPPQQVEEHIQRIQKEKLTPPSKSVAIWKPKPSSLMRRTPALFVFSLFFPFKK